MIEGTLGGGVLGWPVPCACVCGFFIGAGSVYQSAQQAEELAILFCGEKITFLFVKGEIYCYFTYLLLQKK